MERDTGLMELPVLSEGEFRSRWERAWTLMEREKLDLLVVYGDDHALFGNSNVRYLSDFPAHFEPALVLLARDKTPLLVTGPETADQAKLVSKTPRVSAIEEFAVPILEYPGTELPPLRDFIARHYGSTEYARVGIVGLDQISVDHWERLLPVFGAAEIIRLDMLMFDLRTDKSDEELEIFRYAFRLTEHAFEAALQACRPGVHEFEVAAAAEQAMRSRGAEGTSIDTVVASGRENSRPMVGRAGLRILQPGDPVAITLAPKYQGYGAPLGRLVHLGEPPEDIRLAAEAAKVAQQKAAATLKAGVTLGEVDAAARTHLRANGYDSVYGIGHSCGVQEFEPPYFGPGVEDIAKENWVMSIDIGMFNGPWGGFRLEDAFLVTKKAAQPMTVIEPGMVVVPL